MTGNGFMWAFLWLCLVPISIGLVVALTVGALAGALVSLAVLLTLWAWKLGSLDEERKLSRSCCQKAIPTVQARIGTGPRGSVSAGRSGTAGTCLTTTRLSMRRPTSPELTFRLQTKNGPASPACCTARSGRKKPDVVDVLKSKNVWAGWDCRGQRA